MQTVINRAVRFGRATMLAIGAGVVLALVLGVATVALAAVPGDPFKLGKVNLINDATTTLRGGGPSGLSLVPLLEVKRDGVNGGPALRVQNTSAGIGASGVRVDVAQGKAPISVNSEAGKASFLNVDRLDGRDSSDFLPGDTYTVTRTVTGPGGGSNRVASADCDPGDIMLGGGGTGSTDEDDTLLASVPFGQGWDVVVSDNGSPSTLTAHVVCADFPPLR